MEAFNLINNISGFIEARTPAYPGNPKGVYLTDLHPKQTDDNTLLTTFYNYDPQYGHSRFRNRIEMAIEIKCVKSLRVKKMKTNVYYTSGNIPKKIGNERIFINVYRRNLNNS